MAKYFKGNIINVNKLPNFNYDLNIIKIMPDYKESYHLSNNCSHNVLLYFKKYSSNNLKKLVELLKRIISFANNQAEKSELDKIIMNTCGEKTDSVSGYPIIYEKLYDDEGNTYGKELLSGAIFPINNKFSSYDVSYSENKMEKVYYDIDSDKIYFLVRTYGENYLRGTNQEEYKLERRPAIELELASESRIECVSLGGKIHDIVVCKEPFAFKICLSPKMTFSPNQKVDYCISSEVIASELEVDNYLNKFAYGFRKKKNRREYEQKINNFALSNYLGEINFVSDSVVRTRVSEGALTKEIQELEFLLFRLKSVSQADYDILNKEYLEILNQNEVGLHVNPLSLNTIISLQNRAELAFICHGGNCKTIISYLESKVNNYLENYNDGEIEKTKLTLADLDKLSSYFLNSKNSYTIKEQNEILRCLSLLYFFEIYENRDILNSNDLQNSYVADNIKRILVIIGVLYDEGIIKDIPNSLYDISNLDEFLDFIKKIEFNGIIESDGNRLIKRMQQ